MILNIENTKKCTHTNSQNGSCMIAEHKINKQKSFIFLYTINNTKMKLIKIPVT